MRPPAIPTRAVLWTGFFSLILLSWAALFAMIHGARFADVPPGLWGALCLTAADASPGQLFTMWALMSAAMMLPTFVPALRTFVHMGSAGAVKTPDAVALIAGYAVIWALGAALGTVAQLAFAKLGLLAPDGSSLSTWLTAALLITAGLYQFSILKAACLAKCRMPLTFFMERWAPGPARALRMGAELGIICFGCCWALMALAFIGGTMSLAWMGAATVFMTLEKLPDLGRPLTRPAGYALTAAGAIVALRALMG